MYNLQGFNSIKFNEQNSLIQAEAVVLCSSSLGATCTATPTIVDGLSINFYGPFNGLAFNILSNNNRTTTYMLCSASVTASCITTRTAKSSPVIGSHIVLSGTRRRGITTTVVVSNVISAIAEKYVTKNVTVDINTTNFTAASCHYSTNVTAAIQSNSSVLFDRSLTVEELVRESTRYIKPLIKVYFDDVPTEYGDDKLISFSLLEEFNTSDVDIIPIGSISSNELELVIDNTDKYLSINNVDSPLYNKLNPTIKVEAFVIVHDIRRGREHVVPIGVYYTNEFSNDNNQTTIVCQNSLYFKNKVTLPYLPLLVNRTLQEMHEAILPYVADTYSIKEGLTDTVQFAWFNDLNCISVMKQLAKVSACNVITSRDGSVNIVGVRVGDEAAASVTDDELIINAVTCTAEDVYSGTNIKKATAVLSHNENIITLNDVVLYPGSNVTEVEITNCVVASANEIIFTNDTGIALNSFKASTGHITLSTTNTTQSNITTDITVIGSKVTVVYTNNKTNAVSRVVDDMFYSVEEPLMQNQINADVFSQAIINSIAKVNRKVDIAYRGDPLLTLGSVVKVTDRAAGLNKEPIFITRHKLIYDGSLEGTLEGIRI